MSVTVLLQQLLVVAYRPPLHVVEFTGCWHLARGPPSDRLHDSCSVFRSELSAIQLHVMRGKLEFS